MREEEKKQPERLQTAVDKFVKKILSRTHDKVEKRRLVLFDIIQYMAEGSYVFAKLKGIASDLVKEGATYTIKKRYVYCSKGCNKCPHGPYYYIYYRIQEKQNSRYLGKPLW